MIYRDFQGEKLSALGFGTMRLPVIGGDYGKVDEKAAAEMFDYAISHGVNYFDTAWGYHDGESENAVGRVLSAYPREKFNLASKFPGYDLSNMGKAEEIFEVFGSKFLSPRGHFSLGDVHYAQENGITAVVEIREGEHVTVVEATGNGRLDAVSNALKKHFGVQYNLTGYEQHALSSGSFAQAISYLGVESRERVFWGAGENSDISIASVQALVSALNNLLGAHE